MHGKATLVYCVNRGFEKQLQCCETPSYAVYVLVKRRTALYYLQLLSAATPLYDMWLEHCICSWSAS